MRSGRHFLQIPGPSPVPDRILKAMAMPVVDHRGPEFQKLGHRVLSGIKTIFKTEQPVIIYPASGTGAWEAALVNTCSPGCTSSRAMRGRSSWIYARLKKAGKGGVYRPSSSR